MRAFKSLKAFPRLIQGQRKIARPVSIYLRSEWAELMSKRADVKPEKGDWRLGGLIKGLRKLK